jgi:hypothetical protein
LKPELVSAVVTRSCDSFTAAAGRPTMTVMVSLQPQLTSASTGKASIPLTAADKTRARMVWMSREHRRKGNAVFALFIGKWALRKRQREVFYRAGMKTLEQVESDVRMLPPEKQEELRDWLENMLEDQLEFTDEFKTKIERGEQDIREGRSRIRKP